MDDCIFCKIIRAEIPCDKVFENESVLGFKDLHPQAKEHYLFISKQHNKNVNDLAEDSVQLQAVFKAIKTFTQSNELEKNGFRVVTNVNRDGGQTVFHTHFHVLGGEPLRGFGR